MRSMRRVILFCLLPLLSYGQDTLPEITIQSVLPLSQTGSTVTHLDSMSKRQSQEASLADLLSTATPVFLKQEGRGALSTISFRGTAATHTDVLWNGMSIRSPMLGQVDFSLIPVLLSDDISLFHGGASLEKGSGSLGGLIALTNRIHWQDTLKIKGLSGYGNFQTFNEGLTVDYGTQKFHSRTLAYYTYSKNNFKFKNKNIADIDSLGNYIYPIVENNNADYRFYGGAQTLAYRHKHWQIRVDEWFQKVDRSIPRVNTYEGDDYANMSRQDDATNRLVLQAIRQTDRSKWHWSIGHSYESMNYTVRNFISGKGYESVRYSQSESSSFYGKMSYRYHLSKNTTLKIAYRLNRYLVNSYDTVYKNGYNAKQLEQQVMAALQKTIGERLSATVLVRKIGYDTTLVPLIVFAGSDYLLYKPIHLYLKAHLSNNYHMPTLNDLYWQPGGNPDLKAEHGYEGECALSASQHTAGVTWQMQASIYYNAIKDWIIWLPTPQGFWTPKNMEYVESKGSEIYLNVSKEIGKVKVLLNANYAYALSLNKDTTGYWGKASYNKQLPYIPVHSFNFSLGIRYKSFFITYINRSYSERYTTSTNDVSLRDWLYPYYMNHLFLGKQWHLRKYATWDLQIKIFNLFNEEYRSVLGRPMPRQNYLFLIHFNF